LKFTKDSLKIDAAKVADELSQTILTQISSKLKKTGAVVGISGGIDSSVVVALCVKALGPKRVIGVMMPEGESSPDSERLARTLGESLGIETFVEDISAGLEGLDCYILEKDKINVFELAIETPDGETKSKRMPVSAYLQIVAATNYKQRLRMTTLYYEAEKRNWAVAGTGNKDEHEQGFFVKYGDGGADLKPIAHLFKIQVYQLAEQLKLPKEIIDRTPTTDTYSSEVTQAEFFFGLDFYPMDMLWYAMENNVEPSEAAKVLGLTTEQAERGYANKHGSGHAMPRPVSV
jgi:NAD+ synthase